MSVLLSAFPLACIFAALAYSAVAGLKDYEASGRISILGVAATLFGLMLGRLSDRFVPLASTLDDWVNYNNAGGNLAYTREERYLATLSVETALMFIFVSIICLLAVAAIKRDSGSGPKAASQSRGFTLLGSLFVCAFIVSAHGKLAVAFTFILAKAHLL